MKKILLGICLALLTQQCDKEDDKKETSKTDKASNVADCQPAVEAFATNIQPAIATCATSDCHLTGNSATDLHFLPNGTAKDNRAKLVEQDGKFWKEAGNLYQKIGPNYANHSFPASRTGSGHVGKNGKNNEEKFPDEGEITKWTTAEAGCK